MRRDIAVLFALFSVASSDQAFLEKKLQENSQFKLESDSLASSEEKINNRPMIGVLSQPLTSDMKKDSRFEGYTSYIQASYIHYLESAGARAIPLLYHGDMNATMDHLDHLNGVLFCGGQAEGDYITFGKQIFDTVKAKNDQGEFYPAWGTCLGFEDLAQFAATNSSAVLSPHTSEYENPLLTFLVPPETTKLWGPLAEKAYVYEVYNMTLNHHSWGISPSTFETDKGLGSIFTPTAICIDDAGQEFVASMESPDYPFFGTQFHPEKPQFTFYPDGNINHSELSIDFNRYFADFFVDHARRNFNSFESFDVETSLIVENYDVIVTTDAGCVYYAF